MTLESSRRKFIADLGLTVGALSLSSFYNPLKAGAFIVPSMKLAYSAITWGGNDVQAVNEISELGFRGIQLRSNILKEYGNRAEEVKDYLQDHNLEFVMFSSGNANINTGNDEEVISTHLSNAKFVKAAGGKNIQITNSSRPKDGNPTNEELVKYGKLVNEIGKRTQDIGIQTNYHNHMGQLGQSPEEVKIILDNCEDKNVHFLLDIAHYFQGGGDPVAAYKTYKERIHALHLKDVRPKTGGDAKAYTFVELGQGKINLPAFFKTLDESKFAGWGIVELDSVPDKDKSAKDCGNITKSYLQSLNIKI